MQYEAGTHHLIGKDTVDARVVQTHKPVETRNLVVAHRRVLDDYVERGKGEKCMQKVDKQSKSESIRWRQSGDEFRVHGTCR